jgi:hypothetical protein
MKKKDREKEAEQIDEDSSRAPDAWERFRILLESIDQGRKLTEVADHKARYALVLIGVVNAAMIFLGTRSDFLQGTPSWLLPWLHALIIPYIAAGFVALWFAIDCLRPRMLGAGHLPRAAEARHSAVRHHPLGILSWEAIVRRNLDAYQQAWDSVSLGQLNAEMVLIAHALADLNRAKFTAIRRMYLAMFVVIALAAMLLAFDVWFAFLWGPLSGGPA